MLTTLSSIWTRIKSQKAVFLFGVRNLIMIYCLGKKQIKNENSFLNSTMVSIDEIVLAHSNFRRGNYDKTTAHTCPMKSRRQNQMGQRRNWEMSVSPMYTFDSWKTNVGSVLVAVAMVYRRQKRGRNETKGKGVILYRERSTRTCTRKCPPGWRRRTSTCRQSTRRQTRWTRRKACCPSCWRTRHRVTASAWTRHHRGRRLGETTKWRLTDCRPGTPSTWPEPTARRIWAPRS